MGAVLAITAGGTVVALAANDTPIDHVHHPATALAPAQRGLTHLSAASLGTCTEAVHDRYVVMGPDGRMYRTWHAQVVAIDAANPSGPTCRFGHEHGDHGPVHWYNGSGPTTFSTDAHGTRVAAGTPRAIEQYVSRHTDIGIPMNQDQTLMKLHRPTCGPGLAAQN